MNVGKVKELIQERSKMDTQNDVLASQNQEQLLCYFLNYLIELKLIFIKLYEGSPSNNF